MIFLWPIVTLAYFGLGLSATQLGGDIFTTFILAALTEVFHHSSYIIAVIIAWIIDDKYVELNSKDVQSLLNLYSTTTS